MTDATGTQAAATSAGPARVSAGAKLKAAREAAGLSVDAVAHQLKLAPRQVKALEDDDYQRLPGRTFVRGFARNYARFVQLDPDSVLTLMPAPESAPSLERPTLTASRRPMGEIPVERIAKPSAARWLVPLLLAIAVAAGLYEYARSPSGFLRGLLPSFGMATSRTPIATAPSARNTSAAPGATRGTTTTTLPNPVVDAATTPTDASNASAATPIGSAGPSPGANPGAGSSATTARLVGHGRRCRRAESRCFRRKRRAAAMQRSSSMFKGTSWVEVRDASGRLVLQMTGGSGMTQTVAAAPPLELALGNAREVNVTFRGQSLDLGPYTRGKVARVALK